MPFERTCFGGVHVVLVSPNVVFVCGCLFWVVPFVGCSFDVMGFV